MIQGPAGNIRHVLLVELKLRMGQKESVFYIMAVHTDSEIQDNCKGGQERTHTKRF